MVTINYTLRDYLLHTSTHSPQECHKKVRMKKAHTHTISRSQQLNTKLLNKILCNVNHQTVISENFQETKLIPFRRQVGEASLFGDYCPSLQSTVLLSIPLNDLKCHKEKNAQYISGNWQIHF